MKALIVGHGNVGKALAEVLTTIRCEHRFFNGRTVNAEFIEQAQWADIVFNTMSTKGKGEESLRYLLCCVELDRIVVTAEKAALAYHWNILKPHLKKIGFTTTVGGASNVLSLFSKKNPSEIGSLVGILNGTTNFLSWFVQTGKGDINDALREAKEKSLLDSRSASFNSLIDDEIFDALKKSVIIWNSSGIGRIITPEEFSYTLLSQDEYVRLLNRNEQTRFVVSIHKADKRIQPQSGFDLYIRPWHIQGRFVDHAKDLLHNMLPEAEDNILILNHALNGGWESKKGLGAGAIPTAKAMFEEAQLFLAR